MNHCKCGLFKNPKKSCNKVPICSREYQNKIPGPILDRIDIFVEVDETSKYEQDNYNLPPSSAEIAQKVSEARVIQKKRYKSFNIRTNSQLNGNLIKKFAFPDTRGRELLEKFAHKNRISLRSYNKILRVARTIADLDQKETITAYHIAETLNYRSYYSM